MSDHDFHLPFIDAESALERAAAGNLMLVDLRKPKAVNAGSPRLSGTEIRDPFSLTHDDVLTRHPGSLATFCVHGHEVSQFGCALLLLHGRDAVYVKGGYEALRAAGAGLDGAGIRL